GDDRGEAGQAVLQGTGGGPLDPVGGLCRVVVGPATRDGQGQGPDGGRVAAAAPAEGEGGLQAHALVAVGAEGVDQGVGRLGPVVAIDRPQVADGGPAVLGGGVVLLDLGGGALGGVGLLGQVGGGHGRAAGGDHAPGQGAGRLEAVVDQLAELRVTELVTAGGLLLGGQAQKRPEVALA